jgi:hypothetical protein
VRDWLSVRGSRLLVVRVIDWVLLLGEAGDEYEDVESIEGRCAWVDLEREKKPLRKKGLCSSATIGRSFFEEEEGLDNMENVGKQMCKVNKGLNRRPVTDGGRDKSGNRLEHVHMDYTDDKSAIISYMMHDGPVFSGAPPPGLGGSIGSEANDK